MKKIIHTDNAPEGHRPLLTGRSSTTALPYLAGQIPLDPGDRADSSKAISLRRRSACWKI